MRWVRVVLHRLRNRDAVSLDWLENQDRRESRIEYHGAMPTWPIRKLLNESPIWNRAKLRKVS